MIYRYLTIAIILILSTLANFPLAAQDVASEPSNEAVSQQEPSWEPSTFTIEPKRHGGGMAENGTWAVNAGLTIEDKIDGSQDLIVQGTLEMVSPGLCYHASEKIIKGVYLLLIGERIFDANGDYKYGQSILSSGYLTDTGLPVEGVMYGLPTDIFGGNVRHPINSMILVSVDELTLDREMGIANSRFLIDYNLKPEEIPAGYYKFSVQIGIQLDDTHFITLKNYDPATEELTGMNGSVFTVGIAPVGKPSEPRLPWVILPENVSCGGILAKGERDNFAITRRDGGSDIAIIPPVSSEGGQIRYRLEPALPFLSNQTKSPLSLDIMQGEISVSIKTPDGHIIDLGSAPTRNWDGDYLSTGQDRFNFAFSAFGHHEIEVKGYLTERNGLKIYGGGTYDVFVANPIELIPVLKTGMPVRTKETMDLALKIVPPVPAKISVTRIFNPLSIAGKTETEKLEILCDQWGIYTPPASELKKRWTTIEDIRFNRDGEYRIELVAEYQDPNGVLYMGAKTLAGIVHGENTLEIRGEEPATRSTYPQGHQVFTVPPKSDELLMFPPDSEIIFDPDLSVVMSDSIRDQRILMGEKTRDLPDGEIGILPRSTSGGNPAHFYPDRVDRKMYSYVSAVHPDGRTMFLVKDGGPMTSELERINNSLNMYDGDFMQVYGSMVFRDVPLGKYHYSSVSSGAFPKDGISSPSSAPFAGGRVGVYERGTPFLHSFTFGPGTIAEKDKAFLPRCHVFPPTPGFLKVVLTLPNGEQAFFTRKVDDRGFTTDLIEKPIELWQEGVYNIRYSFYPDITDPKAIVDVGVGNVEFNFYVLGNSKENKFAWTHKSGSAIELNQPLNLLSMLPENAYKEGTVYYCVSFNGDLIMEDTRPFTGNGFDILVNVPKIIEDIPNLSMNDPYDVIEICCLVKGVNDKGRNNFMANRTVLRSGRIEY